MVRIEGSKRWTTISKKKISPSSFLAESSYRAVRKASARIRVLAGTL